MNKFQAIKALKKTRDHSALSLIILIAIVACWIMLLPVSPFVQRTTLKRFQLASSSFKIWAVQQVVPSMYNFENRVWTHPQPINIARLQFASDDNIETMMVNHFPARLFTYGMSRKKLLSSHTQFYLYMRSRYRDSELRSVLRADIQPSKVVRLSRLEWDFEHAD